MTVDDIRNLLENEILRIGDSWLRDQIRSHLVPIQMQRRVWEWDESQGVYPIWLVADVRIRNIGIAYADGGYKSFGKPWGLVFINADGQFTGSDDDWYSTLEECLRDSGHFAGGTDSFAIGVP